ncbi:hypothetical protein GCM10023238_31450 [Streptomyces heliomycini]
MQPAPARRPRHGEKGWKQEVADGALFDSVLSIEMTLTGNTLMVGRSQSGTAYDMTSGKKLFDAKKYGDAPASPPPSRAVSGCSRSRPAAPAAPTSTTSSRSSTRRPAR